MNSCSFLEDDLLGKGQDGEGQRAEMERQMDNNYQPRLCSCWSSCPNPTCPSCHLFHQTFPSCSNQSSTNLLDYNRRLLYGPQLFLLPHIDTLYTMSSQFFPLKGCSTFPHHSTLSLVKAKANSIRWEWWYANSKTSCTSPIAMKRACQGQPTSSKKRKKLPWPSPQRSLA